MGFDETSSTQLDDEKFPTIINWFVSSIAPTKPPWILLSVNLKSTVVQSESKWSLCKCFILMELSFSNFHTIVSYNKKNILKCDPKKSKFKVLSLCTWSLNAIIEKKVNSESLLFFLLETYKIVPPVLVR